MLSPPSPGGSNGGARSGLRLKSIVHNGLPRGLNAVRSEPGEPTSPATPKSPSKYSALDILRAMKNKPPAGKKDAGPGGRNSSFDINNASSGGLIAVGCQTVRRGPYELDAKELQAIREGRDEVVAQLKNEGLIMQTDHDDALLSHREMERNYEESTRHAASQDRYALTLSPPRTRGG
eukprot:gene2695-4189_t